MATSGQVTEAPAAPTPAPAESAAATEYAAAEQQAVAQAPAETPAEPAVASPPPPPAVSAPAPASTSQPGTVNPDEHSGQDQSSGGEGEDTPDQGSESSDQQNAATPSAPPPADPLLTNNSLFSLSQPSLQSPPVTNEALFPSSSGNAFTLSGGSTDPFLTSMSSLPAAPQPTKEEQIQAKVQADLNRLRQPIASSTPAPGTAAQASGEQLTLDNLATIDPTTGEQAGIDINDPASLGRVLESTSAPGSLATIDPKTGEQTAIDINDPASVSRALGPADETLAAYGENPEVKVIQDFTSARYKPGMFGMGNDNTYALVSVKREDGAFDVRANYLGQTGTEGRVIESIYVGTLDHEPTEADFAAGSDLLASAIEAENKLNARHNRTDPPPPPPSTEGTPTEEKPQGNWMTATKDVVAGTLIQAAYGIPQTIASVPDLVGDLGNHTLALGHNFMMIGKSGLGAINEDWGVSGADMMWAERHQQWTDDSLAPADFVNASMNAAGELAGIDTQGVAWTTIAPLTQNVVPMPRFMDVGTPYAPDVPTAAPLTTLPDNVATSPLFATKPIAQPTLAVPTDNVVPLFGPTSPDTNPGVLPIAADGTPMFTFGEAPQMPNLSLLPGSTTTPTTITASLGNTPGQNVTRLGVGNADPLSPSTPAAPDVSATGAPDNTSGVQPNAQPTKDDLADQVIANSEWFMSNAPFNQNPAMLDLAIQYGTPFGQGRPANIAGFDSGFGVTAQMGNVLNEITTYTGETPNYMMFGDLGTDGRVYGGRSREELNGVTGNMLNGGYAFNPYAKQNLICNTAHGGLDLGISDYFPLSQPNQYLPTINPDVPITARLSGAPDYQQPVVHLIDSTANMIARENQAFRTEHGRDMNVGILGTQGTVNMNLYGEAIARASDGQITPQQYAGGDLANMVNKGYHRDTATPEQKAQLDQEIQNIVANIDPTLDRLGSCCTHYFTPGVTEKIQSALDAKVEQAVADGIVPPGHKIEFFNPVSEVGQIVSDQIWDWRFAGGHLTPGPGPFQPSYVVSGPVGPDFPARVESFMGPHPSGEPWPVVSVGDSYGAMTPESLLNTINQLPPAARPPMPAPEMLPTDTKPWLATNPDLNPYTSTDQARLSDAYSRYKEGGGTDIAVDWLRNYRPWTDEGTPYSVFDNRTFDSAYNNYSRSTGTPESPSRWLKDVETGWDEQAWLSGRGPSLADHALNRYPPDEGGSTVTRPDNPDGPPPPNSGDDASATLPRPAPAEQQAVIDNAYRAYRDSGGTKTPDAWLSTDYRPWFDTANQPTFGVKPRDSQLLERAYSDWKANGNSGDPVTWLNDVQSTWNADAYRTGEGPSLGRHALNADAPAPSPQNRRVIDEHTRYLSSLNAKAQDPSYTPAQRQTYENLAEQYRQAIDLRRYEPDQATLPYRDPAEHFARIVPNDTVDMRNTQWAGDKARQFTALRDHYSRNPVIGDDGKLLAYVDPSTNQLVMDFNFSKYDPRARGFINPANNQPLDANNPSLKNNDLDVRSYLEVTGMGIYSVPNIRLTASTGYPPDIQGLDTGKPYQILPNGQRNEWTPTPAEQRLIDKGLMTPEDVIKNRNWFNIVHDLQRNANWPVSEISQALNEWKIPSPASQMRGGGRTQAVENLPGSGVAPEMRGPLNWDVTYVSLDNIPKWMLATGSTNISDINWRGPTLQNGLNNSARRIATMSAGIGLTGLGVTLANNWLQGQDRTEKDRLGTIQDINQKAEEIARERGISPVNLDRIVLDEKENLVVFLPPNGEHSSYEERIEVLNALHPKFLEQYFDYQVLIDQARAADQRNPLGPNRGARFGAEYQVPQPTPTPPPPSLIEGDPGYIGPRLPNP